MRIFKIILLIILSLTAIGGILYFSGGFSSAVPVVQMSKSEKQQQKHIIDLTNILKSDPQNPEGYYNLGMAYSDIKDYNSAVNEIKKAFQLHPKTKYETALAQNLLNQERLDEVFNLISETGVNDENTIEKLTILSRAYFLNKNYNQSIKLANKIIAIDKNNQKAYLQIIENYIALKNFDKANVYTQEQTRKYPDNAEFRAIKAKNYYAQEQYDKALVIYNDIITENPTDFSALAGRGQIYLDKKDYVRAIDDAKILFTIDAYANETRYIVAKASFEAGKPQEAFNAYSSLPYIHPARQYAPALLLQAQIAYFFKQDAQAQVALRDYLSKMPDDADALQLMAQIKLRTGSSQQAIYDVKRVIELRPLNIDAYNILATAYIGVGDLKNAEDTFYKALTQLNITTGYSYPKFMLQNMCDTKISQLDCRSPKTQDITYSLLKILSAYYVSDMKKVDDMLAGLIKLNPNNSQILGISGFLNLQNNEYSRAFDDYTNALSIDANNQHAADGMVLLALRPEFKDKIFSFLNNLYAKNPSLPVGLGILSVNGNVHDAGFIALRADMEKRYAQSAQLDFALLNIFQRDKSYTDIRPFLAKLADKLKTKSEFEQFILLSKAYRDLPLMTQALDNYITTIGDVDINILLERVYVYMAQKQYAQSKTLLENILQKYPSSLVTARNLIDLYLMNNQGDDAMIFVRTLDVSSVNKTKLISYIMAKSGNTKGALSLLKQEYTQSINADYLNEIYDLIKMTDSSKNAMMFLEKNYKIEDKNVETAILMGNYYLENAGYVAAERILRTVKDLMATNAIFLNNYALARYYVGESDGIHYVTKALEYDRYNPYYNATYGQISASNGQYADAVKYLDYAYNRLPVDARFDPSLLFALGLSHAKTDSLTEAKKYYQQLVTIDKDYFEKNKLPALQELVQ